jgi:uncharacterized protein YbcV (DUF1398 family)
MPRTPWRPDQHLVSVISEGGFTVPRVARRLGVTRQAVQRVANGLVNGADQAGEATFPQFAEAAWRARVLRWVAALDDRTCTYFGTFDQTYVEEYAAVDVSLR